MTQTTHPIHYTDPTTGTRSAIHLTSRQFTEIADATRAAVNRLDFDSPTYDADRADRMPITYAGHNIASDINIGRDPGPFALTHAEITRLVCDIRKHANQLAAFIRTFANNPEEVMVGAEDLHSLASAIEKMTARP